MVNISQKAYASIKGLPVAFRALLLPENSSLCQMKPRRTCFWVNNKWVQE